MHVYGLFLLIPLLMSFFFTRNRKGTILLLWVFFMPLALFVGLRNEIGPDWTGYEINFSNFSFMAIEWGELIGRGEPAYFLINKLCDEMGWGLHGVMLICALVFLYGVVSYAAKTPDPWLSLAVVMPYLIFVIGMSGIRQAAAIGLGFLMLAHRKEWPLVLQLGVVGLATMFHTSAAVFLLFLLYESKGRLPFRLLMVGAVVWYLYGQWNDPEAFFRYKAQYVQGRLESGGALYHVLLTAFPAVLYLMARKRIQQTVGLDKATLAASLLSVAAVPMVFISSTATDRMVLYFSFVQMMAYPALIKAYPSQGRLLKLVVAGIVCTIFIVFFNFGEHAQYYIPYRNILFE
jgi:hypothetical protein